MSGRATISIPPDVWKVLSEAKIVGDRNLALPPGQLSRELYERVDKVLRAAGGKWDRRSRTHVFDHDPRETLLSGLKAGEVVDAKKVRQAYYTPATLANRMCRQVVKPGDRVLEPSAGEGALAIPARRLGGHVSCVESDALACARLRAEDFQVWQRDFLDISPDEVRQKFDVIVMNPPWAKQQDAKHVLHAWNFLRPGGLLAAIVSVNAAAKNTKVSRALCDLLHGDVVLESFQEDLPEDTFTESGAGARGQLYVVRKQIALAA